MTSRVTGTEPSLDGLGAYKLLSGCLAVAVQHNRTAVAGDDGRLWLKPPICG